jgi:hypothetical protein
MMQLGPGSTSGWRRSEAEGEPDVSVYRTAAQLSQAIAAPAGAAMALCETFTPTEPSVEGAVISGLHISCG